MCGVDDSITTRQCLEFCSNVSLHDDRLLNNRAFHVMSRENLHHFHGLKNCLFIFVMGFIQPDIQNIVQNGLHTAGHLAFLIPTS